MTAMQQSPAYSKKNWNAVARTLRSSQTSAHPVLATLYAEHRYIATLLRLLSAQLDLLEQGEPVDPRILYESLHYMTHYPDAFHHPREDLVYQRAGERDAGLADSVDTLQREHDYLTEIGDSALSLAADWQESGELPDDMLDTAKTYIETMYRHMTSEEKLVFPEIDRVLTPADWRELEQDDLLDPAPDPVFGPRVAREYRNVARKARRTLRRGAEDAALVEWIGLEAFLEGLEVLAIAGESSRAAVVEHYQSATQETIEMVQSAMREGGLVSLPLRCTLNGGSHYIGVLKDLGGIARDTATDLVELRRGVRERLRMVFDQATSSSRN